MPAKQKILWSNHKGGVGKTVLVFHTACAIAQLNPNINVLVMDFTELGDVSKLLFGGVASADLTSTGQGEAALVALRAESRSMLGLLETAANVAVNEPQMVWTVNHHRMNTQEIIDMFERLSVKPTSKLDLNPFITQVNPINKHVPANVFLIPSSGTKQMFNPEDSVRQRVCDVIRNAIEAHAGDYIVVMDTDGDRRFSPFSKVAFGIADHVVIPLETDPTDFKRVRSMLTELFEMRRRNESSAMVKQVVWNKITNIQSDKEGSAVSKLYTPTKVDQSFIQALNKLLITILRTCPGMSAVPLEGKSEDVEQALTTTVRAFGATGHICAHFGIPFATSTPLSSFPDVKIGDVSLGKLDQTQLNKLKANIDLLASQILGVPQPGEGIARRLNL